nr:hypothetical protein [Nostoc sp. ChiSLP01]
MSFASAIIRNPHEIKQIRCRTANPSRFEEIAIKLRKTAREVKREWNNYSPEERAKLKQLAYDLIEPPKGVPNLWLKVWSKAYALFVVLTNQQEALCACMEALDMLIDNILDAIEREDHVYQQVLSDTLEEINSNPGVGEPVDAERRQG